MSRSARLLQLIDLLRRARLPQTGPVLARQLDVSLRTLYRDIATLREQGAAIAGDPGVGYEMRPGFLLPPLMFTPDELEALLLGARWASRQADPELAQAATAALDRIRSALPLELRIEVGGRFVSNQRADGLIVATPTGSTAYALSAGGPMMHPSIPAWVMAPIAPHNLSNRPIVLSDANEVTIEVVAGRDVSANFDMQSLASLQHGDRILVSRAHHSVRFLHPKGWNYFATLRKKLGWNEGGA